MRRRSVKSMRRRRMAPRHPKAPEAKIRLTNTQFLGKFQRDIVDTVLTYVRPSDVPKAAANVHMPSVYQQLRHEGRRRLIVSDYRAKIDQAAKATAKSVKAQIGKALKRKVTADLRPQEDGLTDRAYDATAQLVDDSVDRARDLVSKWEDDDGEDLDALRDDLDEGMDGILGLSLAWASIAFGDAFGKMNRSAQVQEGVAKYEWISQNDSVTRPAHRALDGEEASWDDPLLKSDESDNGEDCYPGDDYNCRCVAGIVADDD